MHIYLFQQTLHFKYIITQSFYYNFPDISNYEGYLLTDDTSLFNSVLLVLYFLSFFFRNKERMKSFAKIYLYILEEK